MIKEILVTLYNEGFYDGEDGKIHDRDKPISKALIALKSEMMEMLPIEEKEENLCHCEFDGNPYIDEKENLIKCRDCGKQIGHKNWNACITETKARVEEVFK